MEINYLEFWHAIKSRCPCVLSRIGIGSVQEQQSRIGLHLLQPFSHFVDIKNLIDFVSFTDFFRGWNMAHPNCIFLRKSGHEQDTFAGTDIDCAVKIRLQNAKGPMEKGFLAENRSDIRWISSTTTYKWLDCQPILVYLSITIISLYLDRIRLEARQLR